MNTASKDFHQKQLYNRLIALWVIIEAFAGGIMHGIKIPFSGLIISGLAMLCIILIAYHVSDKNAIIKATVIVAIFKFMLSPHSPGTAYIALFFQGFMGQILFYNKKYFSAAAVLLGLLGSVESGIQRLLVLLIVYGNEFWKALNQFIHKITGDKSINNYSITLALLYILIHAIAGILIGIYGSKIAKNSIRWKMEFPELIINDIELYKTDINKSKSGNGKKTKRILMACWLLLATLYFYPIVFSTKPIIPNNDILKIALRSFFIILTWMYIISPLSIKLLSSFLESKKLKYQETFSAVITLLPESKAIFIGSWKVSAREKRVKRIKLFVKTLIINTF